MAQPQDGAGRNALGMNSPTSYRGGIHDTSPPSIPPYGAMPPPPSSPPNRHRYNLSFPPPIPRDSHTSPTSSFAYNRDLPALSSTARPGSSMSISSMLGSDPSPSHHSTPPAPPSLPLPPRSGPRDARSHSTGTPPPSYGSNRPITDPYRQGPAPLYPPSHQHPYTPPSGPGSSERPYDARFDRSPLPPRPNSQPAGYSIGPREHELPPLHGSPPHPPAPTHDGRTSYPNPGLERDHRRDWVDAVARPQSEQLRDREPPRSNHALPPPNYSPASQPRSPYERRENQRPPQWRSPGTADASPEIKSRDPMLNMSTSGPPPNHHPTSNSVPPPYPTFNPPRPQESPTKTSNAPRPYHIARSSSQNQVDRRQNDNYQHNPLYQNGQQGIPTAIDGMKMQRKESEDSQGQPIRQRLLSVSPDLTRKGRISPLPQAVHGAQGQIQVPGREPGIQSEFGRMFSGIGSGVGTPSPTVNPQEQANSGGHLPTKPELDGGSSLNDLRDGLNRSSSGMGKRQLRPEDDDRVENGTLDGRLTPGDGAGRGAKRSRPYRYQPTNRDLAQTVEEDATANPTNMNRQGSTASQARNSWGAPSGAHHHHHHHHHHAAGAHVHTHGNAHHHHHHHHHHHSPKPAPVIITPHRKPKIAFESTKVLEEVSRLPRKHLGSVLYNSQIKVASLRRLSKFDFASNPDPVPVFPASADNCTLTIRVPKLYLRPDVREEITHRRALWGTDVYTDDSDLIAAAIHDGWIRGEWDSAIDIAMLNLGMDGDLSSEAKPSTAIKSEPSTNNTAPSTTTNGANGTSDTKSTSSPDTKSSSDLISTIPTYPPVPPAGKDAHITILLLPALQKYEAVTRRGIRSRSWGNNHDGRSFKILSVRWVDEKSERAAERTGEARRKRLDQYVELAVRNWGETNGAVGVEWLGGLKKAGDEGKLREEVVA